jgi:hypothetical protein
MNEVGITERGERDKRRPMSKGAGDLFCRPHCQPRLSDTARPGQGEQRDVGAPQQRLDGGDLALSPDKRS